MPKNRSTPPQAFPTLLRRADYQQRSAEIFRSTSSLDWFIRANRAELAAQGAIVKIAGEVLIDEPRFSEAAKSIGARLAALDRR